MTERSHPARRLGRATAAACAALLLAACAAPGGGAGAGSGQDLRTASDQTDADRRARVRMELAAAYFSRGQYETALDEIKQSLAAKPDLPEAYNLRGLIYGSLDEPKLAEDSFQRALQLAPRDGDAMHNYGWFLCQQKRYADAEAQFQRAVALPQYRDVPRSLLALGVCQAQAGRLAEAEASLVRSYQMEPANPTTAVNLAEVLYRRGDYERARFYIRRVNLQSELSNAQTLWLAVRIEQRVGNPAGVEEFGRQLRNRFPKSSEALALEQRRFND